eukprot:scpid55885/ scgid14547/ Zinc finger protein 28 homolog; Krueppel-like zinc finger factor X6
MSSSPQFKTKAGLKRSYCDQCDKSFSRGDTLRLHKKRIHPPRIHVKPFTCPICKKVSTGGSSFANHMNNVHRRTHFYDCVDCDGSFTYIASLRRHYACVHGGQASPVTCQPGQRKRAASVQSDKNWKKRKAQITGDSARNAGDSPVASASSASGSERQHADSVNATDEANDTSGQYSNDEEQQEQSADADDEKWYIAWTLMHANSALASDAQVKSTPTGQMSSTIASDHVEISLTPSTPTSMRRASLFSVLEQKFEKDSSSSIGLFASPASASSQDTSPVCKALGRDGDSSSLEHHNVSHHQKQNHRHHLQRQHEEEDGELPHRMVADIEKVNDDDAMQEVNVIISLSSTQDSEEESPAPSPGECDTSEQSMTTAATAARQQPLHVSLQVEESDDPSAAVPESAGKKPGMGLPPNSATRSPQSPVAKAVGKRSAATVTVRLNSNLECLQEQNHEAAAAAAVKKRAQLLLPSPIRFFKMLDKSAEMEGGEQCDAPAT